MENRAMMGKLVRALGLAVALGSLLYMGWDVMRAEREVREGKPYRLSMPLGMMGVVAGIALNAVGIALSRKGKA